MPKRSTKSTWLTFPQVAGLVEITDDELAARHAAGYRDGQEEAEDLGEVIDQVTGERRRVKRPARP